MGIGDWGLGIGDWEISKKLAISYYSLPITHYSLPITHYPLPITHYQLHHFNKALGFCPNRSKLSAVLCTPNSAASCAPRVP